MSTALSVAQLFFPVRVTGTYLTEVDGRTVVVNYSLWVFRSRRFGRKREWAYIDG